MRTFWETVCSLELGFVDDIGESIELRPGSGVGGNAAERTPQKVAGLSHQITRPLTAASL
jgi:hypothetical protein